MLLLTQFIVGCSGRQGPFMEIGVGMRATVANEQWTASKYSGTDLWTQSRSTLIEQDYHDATAASVFPTGNMKIGLGFSEQLLVSGSFSMSRLSTLGIGITCFTKKTVPSTFIDITLPISLYRQDFSYRFSTFVVGQGFNAGVGYEFKKNVNARVDFGFGVYDVNTSKIDGDSGAGLIGAIIGVFPGHTDYTGKTTGFSFGLTINQLWY